MMSNAQTFNFCPMGQCWISLTNLYMMTFKCSLMGQKMDAQRLRVRLIVIFKR